MNTNIVITGITGVGKTTIGKILAEKMGKQFIDLDKQIEIRCGVDIATIFAIEGESGFRERETNELRKIIMQQRDYVLSVGGGCVISARNRTLLSTHHIVIQLYAEIEALLERLSKSINKRPLFDNTNSSKQITELYESRKEFYNKISDLKINTSSLKPIHVVEQISKFIQKRHTLSS